MKKTILNLKGASELTRNEQKVILGGKLSDGFSDINPCTGVTCPKGKTCLIDPISSTGFCV